MTATPIDMLRALLLTERKLPKSAPVLAPSDCRPIEPLPKAAPRKSRVERAAEKLRVTPGTMYDARDPRDNQRPHTEKVRTGIASRPSTAALAARMRREAMVDCGCARCRTALHPHLTFVERARAGMVEPSFARVAEELAASLIAEQVEIAAAFDCARAS